jgi:ABC-type transport system involved in cytochrome c biogenesis ATPase subunit
VTLFAGHDLACRRGERLVFTGLSFRVATGAALLLRGPNGSGKSSLLRCMAGLLAPVAGMQIWDDQPIALDADAHRGRLRYLGHQDAVKPALTVLENLARVGRELQLQQLLPHLLLAAAEIGDIGGEHAGARDQLAPEGQQRIEGGAHVGAMAEIVAEIDHAVAADDARLERAMQGRELVGLAVDRRDGPHALALAQHGKLVAIGHARRFPDASCSRCDERDPPLANRRASHGTEISPMQKARALPIRERAGLARYRRSAKVAGQAAFSTCSSFLVAAVSSMASTAASSRTRRSSAA